MCLLIESIKIKDGVIFNLPLHQKRMDKARKDLCKSDSGIALADVIKIPVLYKTGLVKCRILYGKEIQQIEFIPYHFPPIQSLKIVTGDLKYDYKSADRSDIDTVFKKRGNADDVLIIKNGYITDTSFCNVLLREQNNYYTPDTFLLNGIKRQQLLNEGKITERAITADDLKNYDSIHLINAMIDIEDRVCLPIDDINK